MQEKEVDTKETKDDAYDRFSDQSCSIHPAQSTRNGNGMRIDGIVEFATVTVNGMTVNEATANRIHPYVGQLTMEPKGPLFTESSVMLELVHGRHHNPNYSTLSRVRAFAVIISPDRV
jgi:hypothetical protein